ncbi:putative amine oxidase [Lyophyllum shimeji]|uniref:Amine oxidase n=1 Tax=Lyophyllum shimeji TaxID=47721 RepID=A0A9P3PX77_LYOSH|nr:putative amine oxidase [Lyophyllum shimeji]
MSPITVPGTATDVQEISKDLPVALNHPLDPLTPDEINAASLAIRHYIAAKTDVKAIKFITLYLLPPPKKAVLAYLGIPLSPGAKPEPPRPIIRQAEADFVDVISGRSYNAVLSYRDSKWSVDTFEQLPAECHSQISVEELIACEKVVKNNPLVQKLAAEVGVAPDQIFCDGWSIGYDERFPQQRRVQQALLFARFSEHDNLYAHPMDFIPVIDANTEEVLHVDFPPTYKATPKGPLLSVQNTAPPPLTADALSASGRERIPPPRAPFNFLPDLMAQDDKDYKLRNDLKPLHVVQPEGVSFKVSGHQLEWQNWKMHISFTQREGIALSTITYNDHGEVRPIIYRLSLAEMVVPYGAAEYPHPRKFAFDSGEYGMGTMANELSLGCDCLGQIHYLPGAYVGNNGSAVIIKNVICIHEEDDGVLWKHTDYRPNGRSQTVRRRRLVVSMVCTLANYEYIWNYYFYQDGSLEFEIRLTGILQVYVAREGEPSPYGTHVAPGINAQNHQHLFCVRMDPMIDGLHNSVVESDIVPLPDAPTGSVQNFAGNAFVSQETVLKTETGRPYDYQKERRWKIVNPARKHYSSGKDVGYIIGMKGGATPMMARPDSWAAKRAAFVTNALWVCRDVESRKGGRMWPAGKYVPQTTGDPADSVSNWVNGKQNIENDDIVVFVTVGTTHIPRPEDWPVMPVEHLNVTFKPSSFFKVNPSMDVPSTEDLRSVAAFADRDNYANGQANGPNTSTTDTQRRLYGPC